jgi:type II secretory pathway component PulF
MVTGELDADSAAAATTVLSGRGLLPFVVEARTRRPSRRAGDRETAAAFQGLAALVGAGVPLQRALLAAARGASGRLGQVFLRVETRVREGASLATALAAEEGAFSPVTVGLVRAGERGIGLGNALAQTAEQLEREADLVSRVRAALTYPAILAVTGLVSLGVICLVVIPRFTALLADLGQSLPPATRLLVEGSATLQAHWPMLVGALGLVLAGLALGVQRHRFAMDSFLLRVPVIGRIRLQLATARVGRVLGLLLENGTPALQALAISGDSAADAAVAARLSAARSRVAEGSGLAAALTATAALTPNALELATIGEGSGRLGELLQRAAEIEDASAERGLKTLISALEPTLILAFAAVVAFVAAALLQAVYSVRPA